jgi:putative ABC transport system ATP-binding protein
MAPDVEGARARASGTPDPLLVLDRVRIRGRDGVLIDRFDLELAPGQAVALMGPSGCGKSLLLRVAAGLDRPDAGERRASESLRAGFVFQEGGLLRNVTVEENLLVPLYYSRRGLGQSAARQTALAALERFGVAGVAGERPGDLLNETRILVQIARAAALEANLLFLDDPFPLLAVPAETRVARWIAAGLAESRLAVMMTAVEPQSVPRDLSPVVVPLGARVTREDVDGS